MGVVRESMPKVYIANRALIDTKNFQEIEDSQIAVFDEQCQGIRSYGMGPCILFIAYLKGKPIGAFHWSNFKFDKHASYEKYIPLIQKDLRRFAYQIADRLELLFETDSSCDSENEDIEAPEYEDNSLLKQFEMLPVGGQADSQNVIQAIKYLAKNGPCRFLSTKFLKISLDNDFICGSVDKNGDVYVEHISSRPDLTEYQSIRHELLERFAPYYLLKLKGYSSHIIDHEVYPPLKPKCPSKHTGNPINL